MAGLGQAERYWWRDQPVRALTNSKQKLSWSKYGDQDSEWVWTKRIVQRCDLLKARAGLCPRLKGEQDMVLGRMELLRW